MSKLKDLTGMTFGNLTVIKRLPNYRQKNGRTRTRWLCKCACGNDYIGDGSHILHGNVISCGCLLKKARTEKTPAKMKGLEKSWAQRRENLTGMRFGKLLVIKEGPYDKRSRKRTWVCLCDCGNYTIVRVSSLKKGDIQSCGCVKSRGEEYIVSWLNQTSIKYKREIAFEDLRSSNGGCLRFDFGFFDEQSRLIALLEFQGMQHKIEETGEFGKQQREETDQLKKEYCKRNNIPLFEIWQNENIEYELMVALTEIYRMAIPCQADNKSEDVTTISEESRKAMKFSFSEAQRPDRKQNVG